MKVLTRIMLVLLLVVFSAVAGYLAYMTLTDYEPPSTEIVYDTQLDNTNTPDSVIFVTTWNIGFAGLDADMDFFYDGGTRVRPTVEQSQANLQAITTHIQSMSSHIILLQEVDRRAKRSHYTDQWHHLAQAMPSYEGYFTTNYKSPYVPSPITDPMGPVWSGLASLSRYKARMVVRHAFVGNYSWPKHLAMLDRCFMAQYYPLNSGQELVIVNTHNSAYDDGTLKQRQNAQLAQFLNAEYAKGNYIVVGGDWNQTPPTFKAEYTNTAESTFLAPAMPLDFMPEWSYAYDPTAPTNRELNAPYRPQPTYTETIDYFLISPNIELVEVRTEHLQFEHSDHNPVHLQLKLKPN